MRLLFHSRGERADARTADREVKAGGGGGERSMGINCLRIATEEAYAPPEMFERYRKLLESGTVNDPGFESLVGFYLTNPAPRIKDVRDRLEDVGARRIAAMNATGIARQILSLTAPGVQVFDEA